MHMYSAVYCRVVSVRLCVCHTSVLCRNNRDNHQAIRGIALNCGLGLHLRSYGHQTWNIISLGILLIGDVK